MGGKAKATTTKKMTIKTRLSEQPQSENGEQSSSSGSSVTQSQNDRQASDGGNNVGESNVINPPQNIETSDGGVNHGESNVGESLQNNAQSGNNRFIFGNQPSGSNNAPPTYAQYQQQYQQQQPQQQQQQQQQQPQYQQQQPDNIMPQAIVQMSGLKNYQFSRETLTSVKNRCGVLI